MPSPAEHESRPRARPAVGDAAVPPVPAVPAGPATSAAPRARIAAEWALRALAAALVVWMLVRALAGAGSAQTEMADARTLAVALERWTTVAAPAAVHVRFDSAPGSVARDWLAALPGAGTRVTWTGGPLPALVIAAGPVADPAGATRVRLAAPPGEPVALRDVVGALDTVSARRGEPSVGLTIPAALESVDGSVRGATARAVVGDSLVLRRVLVLGQVGWESRFVVDALEERGWRVDAHLALAPGNDIVQGAPGTGDAIDTARYAAVVALDTSVSVAARGGRLVAYVRSGGGLVLAGSASQVAAFRAIAPGGAGPVVRARPLAPLDSSSAAVRAALALVPIVALQPGAVPLDTRGAVVALAVRRVGPGRVLQAGYADTWRWRMMVADGVRAHRDWWAGLVGDVAYAPAVPRERRARADPAPLAGLIDALGRPGEAAVGAAAAGRAVGVGGGPWRALVFAAIVLAVLAEWASRRMRGAR